MKRSFRGKSVLSFNADITHYEEMNNVASQVIESWKKVDILVNNAGIVNPLAPSEKIKKDDFDRTIDINLKGAFYATQIFGKCMIEQKTGRIINIASQVAFLGERIPALRTK